MGLRANTFKNLCLSHLVPWNSLQEKDLQLTMTIPSHPHMDLTWPSHSQSEIICKKAIIVWVSVHFRSLKCKVPPESHPGRKLLNWSWIDFWLWNCGFRWLGETGRKTTPQPCLIRLFATHLSASSWPWCPQDPLDPLDALGTAEARPSLSQSSQETRWPFRNQSTGGWPLLKY